MTKDILNKANDLLKAINESERTLYRIDEFKTHRLNVSPAEYRMEVHVPNEVQAAVIALIEGAYTEQLNKAKAEFDKL